MSTNAASDLMKTSAVSRGLVADKLPNWNIELLMSSGVTHPTGHAASDSHGRHGELPLVFLEDPPGHGTQCVLFTVAPGGQGRQLALREEP